MVNKGGSVRVTVAESKHPFASVTKTIYEPDASNVAVALVCEPGSSHV